MFVVQNLPRHGIFTSFWDLKVFLKAIFKVWFVIFYQCLLLLVKNLSPPLDWTVLCGLRFLGSQGSLGLLWEISSFLTLSDFRVLFVVFQVTGRDGINLSFYFAAYKVLAFRGRIKYTGNRAFRTCEGNGVAILFLGSRASPYCVVGRSHVGSEPPGAPSPRRTVLRWGSEGGSSKKKTMIDKWNLPWARKGRVL